MPFFFPQWRYFVQTTAEVLGIVAAAGQLAGYVMRIVSLTAELASDVKSGLRPILKEVEQVQEFILIAQIIRQGESGAPVDVRSSPSIP